MRQRTLALRVQGYSQELSCRIGVYRPKFETEFMAAVNVGPCGVTVGNGIVIKIEEMLEKCED